MIIISACSTTPHKTGDFTDLGVWTGKVQMTNKQTNHRKWANVTWASDSEQNRMRVDISAILDVPIASFLKNPDGYHLWLYTEKTYYHSMDGEKLFKHLTKLSVDPNIFYAMLGVPKSPGQEWKCDSKSQVMKCSSGQKQTRFSVQHDDPDRRIIKVEKDRKALRVRLSRTKVQLKDDMFKKLSTSQFKTYQL